MDLQGTIANRPRAIRATAACEQCRRSKIRCNGQSPCAKCSSRKIPCVYREAPPNPIAERFEILESRLRYLEERFQGPSTIEPVDSTASAQWSESLRANVSDNAVPNGLDASFAFHQSPPDVVARGIIALEDAYLDYCAFFDGCEQFVPVFDRVYDTFESIRQRSHVLFDTICTIGRRTRQGHLSPTFRRLNNELKTRLCEITLREVPSSVEVVQALLVISSYTDKGWLLTALATRLAIDIDLHQCLRTVLLSPRETIHADSDIQKARVWLGTVNLDHIFSLDSGKEPNWQSTDGVEGRRCRILLDNPASRPLDAHLICQVEMNLLRAHAHRHIPKDILFDDDLVRYVHGLKLDTDIWYQDWKHIVSSRHPSSSSTSPPRPSSSLATPTTSPFSLSQFLISAKVIQCWAEIMISCKLIQHIGIENIDAMSATQREIVVQAFHSAREHLHQLLKPPRAYLASFRFAMEFTHAKCAFSVLLLLKLAMLLLPRREDLIAIVADAGEIVRELAHVQTCPNVYFRILELSIAKAKSFLKAGGGGGGGGGGLMNEMVMATSEIARTPDDNGHNDPSTATAEHHSYNNNGRGGRGNVASTVISEVDSALDLQTFVPSEFVFEWDFPGLTLFSRPLDFQMLFTDFATGV